MPRDLDGGAMKFPGAPLDATYTEEGWLAAGDECWTPAEWSLLTPIQRRKITGDVPLVGDTPAEAKRRRKRERDRVSRALRRQGHRQRRRAA